MALFRSNRKRLIAPKMTITQERPWTVTVAMWVASIAIGGAVALWTYDMGRSLAFGPKIDLAEKVKALEAELDELKDERDKLAATANTSESQQNIERSTQKQLAEQVKTLTTENIKLKDDLAFFESLMPSATGPAGITIQRVSADMTAPNQLRYRVLVMQGGKGDRDFVGELQLSLTLTQAGKPVVMPFPDPKTGETGKLKLSFRHYQRLEGIISLPEGVTVRAVQAKVMDRGQQRAQQSVNL
jgi:hypothetical protein